MELDSIPAHLSPRRALVFPVVCPSPPAPHLPGLAHLSPSSVQLCLRVKAQPLIILHVKPLGRRHVSCKR